MQTYLIDYFLLDQKGERESEFHETIELEAASDDGIKEKVLRYLSEKDIGCWDIEIASVFCD